MQKKKLDLNHLLAKYEGAGGNSNYNSRYQEPIKQSRIDEQFYQNKTYQQPDEKLFIKQQIRDNQYSQTSKSFRGNFAMSKSEVEQFLLSIKDELRTQQKSIVLHSDQVIKQIHQNFHRNHEKIKRQMLDLLQRTFIETQRIIKDELAKQSKIDPPEFSIVYKRITSIDEDVNKLLNTLKGPQYRKAIAQVVIRDFNIELNELRASINSAKTSYIFSLGEIQIDRTRIDNIKDNLQKLFYFNKKAQSAGTNRQNNLQQSAGIFSIFKDKTQFQNQPKIQISKPENSRTRKSFFNFGGD